MSNRQHDEGHMQRCALCRKNETLKTSHFIPKSAYKHTRRIDPLPHDPAYILYGRELVTKYGSRQVTKKALCYTCEDLVNKGGEAHVALNGYEDDRFVLDETLANIGLPPDRLADRVVTDPGRPIDSKKFYYFAVSIVCRACAIDWSPFPNPPSNLISDHVESSMRNFLLEKMTLCQPSFVSVSSLSDYSSAPRIEFPQFNIPRKEWYFVLYGTRFRVWTSDSPIKPLVLTDRKPIIFHRSSYAR